MMVANSFNPPLSQTSYRIMATVAVLARYREEKVAVI